MNGVELDHVDEGFGTPVVFSHGGSSDRRYWEPQRELFAGHFRFVTYSRRFHGPGEWASIVDASTEAHVADLVEVMRRVGEPVHLVGFSTSLTLRATIAAAGLVRSLTIIEPNVPWLLEHDAEGAAILARWRSDNERVTAESGGDADAPARCGSSSSTIEDPERSTSSPRTSARCGWRTTPFSGRPLPRPNRSRANSSGRSPCRPWPSWPSTACRTSRRIVEVLASCIPGAELVELPGATHFVSYQHPPVFNRVLLDFLARTSR